MIEGMHRISNSATMLGPADRGAVVICGSHAGSYPAYLAAIAGVKSILLSDAGMGLDKAGIGGLSLLDDLGIAAAAVSGQTARIGDGADMAVRGRLSAVNACAAKLGCRVDMAVAEAADLLTSASLVDCRPAPFREARHVLRSGVLPVVGVDSTSLVSPEDVGAMVVSGSHGGLIGETRSAIKYDVAAAVYHDAGGGVDDAGFSRLPALDELSIIGVTVDGMTARIGDAASLWNTGVISRCNVCASKAGLRVGLTVQQMADILERQSDAPKSANLKSERVMNGGRR